MFVANINGVFCFSSETCLIIPQQQTNTDTNFTTGTIVTEFGSIPALERVAWCTYRARLTFWFPSFEVGLLTCLFHLYELHTIFFFYFDDMPYHYAPP